PWLARTDGELAAIEGTGLGLIVALPRLARIGIERDPAESVHTMRWLDWDGSDVLQVSLTEDSRWSGFHSPLTRQWTQRGGPREVLTGQDGLSPLQHLNESLWGWDCTALKAAWYPADKAGGGERPGICAQPVNPELVAPFLEALTEHACRLRVLLGNNAALHAHETDFYDCRFEDTLTLRGDTAILELDPAQLGGAWVIKPGQGDNAQRILRLTDQHGRTVLTLAASAADAEDPSQWRTLLDILCDYDEVQTRA
ncbi:MAG: hypothetical protein KDJ38_18185, partial [Gammaproteobacteria bacterium]|nr:hypothetical protein [Gammaproteobacteria bacterium]